jgi:ABC-2 type transport system permease protein
MYWVAQAGRAALEGSWVGWRGVAVLAGWTLVFGTLASRAYRRSTLAS